VEEAEREEVLLHSYDFHLDILIMVIASVYTLRIKLGSSSLERLIH